MAESDKQKNKKLTLTGSIEKEFNKMMLIE